MLYLILSAIALASLHSFVHAAVPSSRPTSCACPTRDNGGYKLEISDYTPDDILCTYPTVAGSQDFDFFCTYSKVNGRLVQDHDAGFCPSTAILAHSSERRGITVPRAPLPSRSINTRNTSAGPANKVYLKKRREDNNA